VGTRAPNLLTDETGTGPIGVRCGKREPGKSCKQYLFESLDNPTAYVVPGYQPIMPVMTKQLSPEQVWAVIAFLESQGGTVDVTGDDIAKSKPAPPGGSSAGGGSFAGSSTDPKAIRQAVALLVAAYVLIVYLVPLLPGSALVPQSVVLQYMTTVLVGVLIYVSDNEERWTRFREPIHAALVEPRLRPVRAGLLVAVPAL